MVKNKIKTLIKWLFVIIGVLLLKVKTQIEIKSLPQFANKPRSLTINLPRCIVNPERIYLGDNVRFGPGCFLLAFTEYLVPKMNLRTRDVPIQKFSPIIKIGNNVSATANVQISAVKEIIIEDDVMFASNIFVGDHLHGYEYPDTPYKYQPICRIEPITIKKGCWIGQGVIVMPGVTIGEYTVIGANSVVTKDIAPRCIAFGSPAKIFKKWNSATNKWDIVNEYDKKS